jgi:hypothetical protein
LEHGWFQHDSLNQQYFRIHAPLGAVPREQGNEVFNTLTDKPERKNIFDTHGRAGYDSLLPFLQAVAKLNTYAVEANVLWPDSSQPNSPSRAK